MRCQKNIADKVIEQKGDYILRVKANQSGLLEAMQSTFKTAQASSFDNMVVYSAVDEVNNDHGRIESRKCIVLPLRYLMLMQLKWCGLKKPRSGD